MRLFLLIPLMLLAACRDECIRKNDPGRCEANIAINCPEPGVDQLVPVRWRHEACDAKVCVLALDSAFCTLDGGASAFCPGGSSAASCDGKTRVSCNQGFETGRDPCLSCDPDGGICNGGPSSRCGNDTDCESPFFCRDAGSSSFCTKR